MASGDWAGEGQNLEVIIDSAPAQAGNFLAELRAKAPPSTGSSTFLTAID